MGTFPVTFDPSNTKIRLGLQSCKAAEPAAADLVYFPVASGAATSFTIIGIEDPSFQVGQKALPVPGPVEISGDMTFSTAPDAVFPLEAAALINVSAVTDLGGGAYKVLLGPSQANQIGVVFMEIDNSDPSPMAFYDVMPTTITWAVESGGLFTVTASPLATTASRWAIATESHPGPFTGRGLQVRGVPQQNFERDTGVLDASAVDLYFRCIDNSGSIPVWVAMVGQPLPLTGTVEMTGTTELQGTGTAFTTQLYRGDNLDLGGAAPGIQRTVISVESDTSATMSATATVAAGTKAIREYGTAHSVGQSGMGFPLRVGLDGDSLEQYGVVSDSVTGAKMGRPAEVGHSVEAWQFSKAGIPVPTSSALTGTFTVSAASPTITGAGSSLIAETMIGGQFTTLGGQVVRIKSVTSATVATADVNFTSAEAGVACTFIPIPTFALTGTWSATASATLTGVGGAALTEIGSGTTGAGMWLRAQDGANQGVIARVVSVATDDSVVVHQAVTIAAGTTLESDIELTAARLRPTWTPTALASGPQPSTQCPVLFEIDALDAEGNALIETQQRLATSFSLPWNTGAVAGTVPLGTAWQVKTDKTTVSQGQATVVIEKVGKSIAELIEANARVRVRLAISTGKQISTSAYEYSKNLVFHGKFGGVALQAPSADERNETVLIDVAVPDTADPDFPDSVNMELFTDRSDPAATTPLT